jgi:peptidoglycan/LPS O-acetylase OafA/YrhL
MAASPGANPAVPGQHDYRPHIDGLRAVAILSVVVYHALPNLLPGGFVGVDIFFVISGFLISGIIFRQLDKGRFSFADFYIRRIRRIFPALTVVLAFVLLAGWLALLTDEYASLGLHAAAGASSLQNILLWTETGYFNVNGALKPLLHLWSLGVEEQFYLAWPLFVVLFGRSARALSWTIIGLAIASFVIGWRYLSTDPDAAFYLPLARFWELMIGCWLANLQRGTDATPGTHGFVPATGNRHGADGLAAAGTLLIAIAVFAIEGTDPFPGWRALLPTLGSALLIKAGPDARINRHLLSHPVAVFFGLISYPLYLWHWPLLSFGHIISVDRLSPRVAAGLMIVAILLAWLTYVVAEGPLRTRTARVPTTVGLATAMACLAAVGLFVHGYHIQPYSSRFGLERIVAAASEPFSPPEALSRTVWQGVGFPTVGDGPKVTLILGDSHAEHYYSRTDQLLQDGMLRGRRVVFGSHPGCPPIAGVDAYLRPDCEEVRAAAFAYSVEPAVDTVVIAANWSDYLSSVRQPYTIRDDGKDVHINPGSTGFSVALQHLEARISSLVARGKRVYFVLQMPRNPKLNPRKAIDRDAPLFDFKVVPASISTEEMQRRFARIVDPLRDAAIRGGAIVLDPIAELCGHDTCPVLTDDGLPLYHDDGHFSAPFARHFVTYLDAAFTGTTVVP